MDRIPTSLDDAIIDNEQRKSIRTAEELKLEKAKELMNVEAWDAALKILRPLWQTMTYRTEGWWDIVEDIGWALRTSAAKCGDGEAVVWADWELMNSTFPFKSGWTYDLSKSLDGIPLKGKPSVVIREDDVHSFLSATFAFEQADVKVADVCVCQMTITSHASKVSAPMTMSEVRIAFEGGLKPILLRHEANETGHHSNFAAVDLSEGSIEHDSDSSDFKFAVLEGKQDLTLAAGHSKVFQFAFPLREAGQARATSATFSMDSEAFDLDYVVSFDQLIIPDIWWVQERSKRRLVRIDPYMIDISPKPPKMDVRFVDLHEQYYTNEIITLRLEVTNGEEEDSIAKLDVYITGEDASEVHLSQVGTSETIAEPDENGRASGISLGTVASARSTFVDVDIPASEASAAYDLMVDLSYNLVSDPETQMSKTMSIRLFVVSPFEANYDFQPRFDPTPWPSFFTNSAGDVEAEDSPTPRELSEKAAGIIQRWSLTGRYASFALTPLLVTNVSVATESLNAGITCAIMPDVKAQPTHPSEADPLEIDPNAISEAKFAVITQKLSLDDRRSASMDLTLAISWRRFPSDPDIPTPINTTHLPVPRLLLASQEPRVLLTRKLHPSSTPQSPVLMLSYTIENPSMHFLTFGTTMNPSEDFAFSGKKSGTVQLVPLSRRTANFVVIPRMGIGAGEVDGGKWIWPVFLVRDRYFQKLLKVCPGEGCRIDREVEGVGVWISSSGEI